MRSKFFFLHLTLINAGFFACAFFVLTSIYKIHLLYSDVGPFSVNMEAVLEPFRIIVTPVIDRFAIPTSLMPEGKMSSAYVVLINTLWLAVPAFVISFIGYLVPFLLIDLLTRQKARIPYYFPCFAFIFYLLFFFGLGVVFALDISVFMIILIILIMISLIFIINRYTIHPLNIRY